MKVILLGTGAGGGVPQWNCGCANCAAARRGDAAMRVRTQSSIAVSADGARWLLVNASPDVRVQLQSAEELHPAGLRDTPLAAVAVTNADIDHSAGLLVLREGGAPPLYCSSRVRRALTDGLRIIPALEAFGPVRVRSLVPGETAAFYDRHERDLGLRAEVFAVASKPAPYMLPLLTPAEAADDLAGDTVGLSLYAEGSSSRVVYVPGVRDLDDALRAQIARAALVLIDGTFTTDDEMVRLGASAKTAHQMGHAPLQGSGGLVEFLDGIVGPRKVLVHINNSNPALREGAEVAAWLAAHDITVGHDGMRLTV